MTFDPIKFLKLANDLFVDGNYDEEEKYRTCVSRAYYAAHLFTREKLKKLKRITGTEVDERKGEMHQKVIDALKYMKEENKIVWGEKKEKKLWQRLNKLKLKRGDADYNLNENFQYMEKTVKFYIEDADDIIQRVNKLTLSDFLET